MCTWNASGEKVIELARKQVSSPWWKEKEDMLYCNSAVSARQRRLPWRTFSSHGSVAVLTAFSDNSRKLCISKLSRWPDLSHKRSAAKCELEKLYLFTPVICQIDCIIWYFKCISEPIKPKAKYCLVTAVYMVIILAVLAVNHFSWKEQQAYLTLF